MCMRTCVHVCVCFVRIPFAANGSFQLTLKSRKSTLSFQFHILCSRIALVSTFSHEVQFGPVWPFVTLDKGKILPGKVKVQGTNEMVIWERESARCFFWDEDLGRKMKRIDDKAINSHVDAGSTLYWEKSKIYVENLEPVGNWMVTALMQWTITEMKLQFLAR